MYEVHASMELIFACGLSYYKSPSFILNIQRSLLVTNVVIATYL